MADLGTPFQENENGYEAFTIRGFDPDSRWLGFAGSHWPAGLVGGFDSYGRRNRLWNQLDLSG
jgi:hypothetical protein